MSVYTTRQTVQDNYLDCLDMLTEVAARFREYDNEWSARWLGWCHKPTSQELDDLFRPYDPCEYHADHECRKCHCSITDMEYVNSGLFLGLCTGCLASARQTLREETK